ncbi:MAG TPA: thioesterase family protein [Chloroflexota bacterium]|nr:thioesterase family protein [Chloroflexota bacterium]
MRVQVGWGDCDPAGIVFYPRFYAWMDTVSHVLAREMGIPRESMIPPGSDMFGFPVVGTEAQYLTPARMDDLLEVRTWVVRVGRSSLSLRHEIVRVEPDGAETLIVRGREDRVFTAHGPDGLRSRELTQPMRAALSRFADPLAATASDNGLQRS